jgi:hypothetical protein
MEPPDGMEAEPRMDASAPSPLRLAGFGLTALGALVIGVGVVLTWVSVGLSSSQGNVPTQGIDTTQGKIALGCAVVTLILIIVSRITSDAARAVLVGVVVALGAFATGAAAMFIRSAPTNYNPANDPAIVAQLAALFGQTPDQIRAALSAEVVTVGPGAWIVMVGGLTVIMGGVLTVRWAARLSADRAASDEDAIDEADAYGEPPHDGEPTEDPMPAMPDAQDGDETSFD